MKVSPHPDFEKLKQLFPAIREYQALASRHGIGDVFQDNGGKILQVCLALGLKVYPARMGNDATDADGNEYELKTVNILRTTNFTTHHHLNHIIIAKYRQVPWIFTTYEGIELKEIYLVSPDGMEECYKAWETKLGNESISHINNPKISLSYVRRNGKLLYATATEGLEETKTPKQRIVPD